MLKLQENVYLQVPFMKPDVPGGCKVEESAPQLSESRNQPWIHC